MTEDRDAFHHHIRIYEDLLLHFSGSSRKNGHLLFSVRAEDTLLIAEKLQKETHGREATERNKKMRTIKSFFL